MSKGRFSKGSCHCHGQHFGNNRSAVVLGHGGDSEQCTLCTPNRYRSMSKPWRAMQNLCCIFWPLNILNLHFAMRMAFCNCITTWFGCCFTWSTNDYLSGRVRIPAICFGIPAICFLLRCGFWFLSLGKFLD